VPAPLTQPVNPKLTNQAGQAFGPRVRNGRRENHLGQDYSTPRGTPLFAVQSGVVSLIGGSRKHVWGFYLHIELGDGYEMEHHVLRDDPAAAPWGFKKGDRIELGQLIGYTGDTDAYLPHHHWGYKRYGIYLDPARLLFHSFTSGGSTAGGSATPFPNDGDEFMTEAQFNHLKAQGDITTGILGTMQNQMSDGGTGVWPGINDLRNEPREFQLFRDQSTRELRLFSSAGHWWRVPSDAYADLLVALKLTRGPRDIPSNQFGFIRDVLVTKPALPDIIAKIESQSEETVKKIVAEMKAEGESTTVTLDERQLDYIVDGLSRILPSGYATADDVAAAVVATRQDIKAALSALTLTAK
jgi:hypothetical protein